MPRSSVPFRPLRPAAALLALTLAAGAALAQEAVIRKNLADRMPNLPKIDEVTKGPIPGLYEVRIGHEIFYTDEQGNHIINGQIIDTRSRTNVTEARIDKLTAIDFDDLPLKDALVYKQGTGARKLAVFADPNCGYCKRIERDLLALKDVTIYTFVLPILGPDSNAKSRDIWCAKDAPKSWRDWMIDNKPPVKVMGQCDTAALERNTEFSRKYRINGTPAVIFPDGTRSPGALPLAELERRLAEASKKG